MNKYPHLFYKGFTLFCAAFVCCCSSLFGQYTFEQISKAQGLPHNSVEAIIQDKDGLMWFGTRDGLCRYDGYAVKVFRNTSESSSISGNRIMAIAEDNSGFLWIGTYQNGLNRFDKKKNSFTKFGSSEGIGNQVYRIKVLSDGAVYVGSNEGLAIFYPDSDSIRIFTPDNSPGSINSYAVSDILETRSGHIYIATWENEIQEYDPGNQAFKSISYIPENLKVENYRKRMIEDTEGNLFIAAQLHGLFKYSPQTGAVKFFNEGNGQLNTEVLNGDMILTPEGNIWISTDIGGINVFYPKEESFEYIRFQEGRAEGLPSDHIYTFFLDRSNRIWVGTFDQGIAIYDPQMNKFRNQLFPEKIYSFFQKKSVLSLLEDSGGTIWIGTDGFGLHELDNQMNLTSYYADENDQNTISSNVITSLEEDASGNILIGTYSGGLNIYDPKSNKIKIYKPNVRITNALHSDNVWTILSDSEDRIWLGLLGSGADLFHPENQSFLNLGPYSTEVLKIGHPNVMSLMEDSDGDIWFGTEGNGIYVIDKQANKVIRISTDSESRITEEGIIKALFQDSQGNIWIATEGSGLFKYNEGNKHLEQYTTEHGLPGMIVLGIQEDNSGNIWASTYDGLAIHRKSNNRFTSFYNSDGLSSNEFNGEAFIKLRNGTFMLGSINGIDIFDPLSIQFNQNIPKVLFTQLTVMNKIIEAGDSLNGKVILTNDILYTTDIELTATHKTFSVEFAALNFTHPEKCQYRYMLEGFDDNWILTPVDYRIAAFSNLKDGEYILKVEASNNDGKWGNNLTELKITVLPPWWKTGWFLSLSGLFIILILIRLYTGRIKYIRNKYEQDKAESKHRIIELEKENIESELEKLTYYTVNRNRVLINYKNRLQSLSNKAKESVKKGLYVVIEDIEKEIADDKEWAYIEPRLDKFHNNFITKLREKHPNLTLSEIKIAAYVRMNLTSKEISEFMHKTIRAVENDRYRLRKKINLDSNESLQTYLMNL